MRTVRNGWFLLSLVAVLVVASPLAADHHGDDGFISIFDGKGLDGDEIPEGWSGIEKFWSVEDGAITGQTTASNPTRGNTFCVWTQGEVDDFELKLEYRIFGGNSGVQYRSREVSNYVISGYQADFEAGDTWSGTNYHEKGRGVLAKRGEKTIVYDGKKARKVIGSFGKTEELQTHIKKEDWNSYHIIARGRHLIHKINGQIMSEVFDRGTVDYSDRGLFALQLHAGPPMKVQFRNIRLKRLPLEDRKKVVFIAGTDSHGKGQHEFLGGCEFLAKELNENMRNIDAVLYAGGWPDDPTALANADAVVVYCDGAKGHPLKPHLAKFDKLMEKGVGLVCLHFAVEVEAGEPGDHFLKWLGGYFELNWSVNPHWVASYDDLPEHPITRGVTPFEVDDEWYYHMRFRDDMKGVTPILTDLPPPESLNRKDGGRSGNPTVRAAIARGERQHTAWAVERDDGGRGFGFTGGHFHRSWANENFRKLVLNAIAWSAKVDVPANGVPSKPVTVGELWQMIGLSPDDAPKN